jgi:hypothetical protein
MKDYFGSIQETKNALATMNEFYQETSVDLQGTEIFLVKNEWFHDYKLYKDMD